MKNALASLAAAAVSAASLLSSTASANLLQDWNLIVLGDLFSNSEVEGNAFIGGNLSGPASNYGTMLDPAQYAGQDVLVVGGSILSQNINLNAGNLRLGGSLGGNVNFNGGGSLIADPSVAGLVPGIASQLAATSAYFAGLGSNSGVQIPGGQPGAAIFNASPGAGGIAVFDIDGASLFSNGFVQQIELNANGAAAIVVNVTGTTINFDSGNFVGAWNSIFARANTIWNFHEATSISLDRAFNGAILAPNAHLTNSTVIDGSVFVKSFDQFGEVHLPFYTGVVPGPAPLALLALAALVGGRRRRDGAVRPAA